MTIPEDSKDIVAYFTPPWESKDSIFIGQWRDWAHFRGFQRGVRKYYLKRGTFHEFIDQVRARREKHGLDGDVRLLPEPDQQSWLENWVEFQNYHLMEYEKIFTRMDDERERIAEIERERGLPPGFNVEEGPFIVACKAKANLENGMLQWIERQRRRVVEEQSTSTRTAVRPDKQRRKPASTSSRLLRPRPNPRPQLGPVRSAVSKKTPKSGAQRRGRDAHSTVGKLAIKGNSPQSNPISTSDLQAPKPVQMTKTTSLPPRHPVPPPGGTPTARRTARRKHASDFRANSPSIGEPRRGSGKNGTARVRRQRPNPMPSPRTTVITTRSGRVSKRPERLGLLSPSR